MPIETRYFRSDQHTVNGLTAFKLLLETSGVGLDFVLVRSGAYLGGDLGVRVWKRDVDGVETEITGGSPVAVVTFWFEEWYLEKSAVWNCPEVALNPTDCIVVRVYGRIPNNTGAWTLMATFCTEQLGAQVLNASPWTIYYIGSYTVTGMEPKYTSRLFFHVDGAYISRITNFSWSVGVGVVKKLLMNGFVLVESYS